MDDKSVAYSNYINALSEIAELLRNEEVTDSEVQQNKQSELSGIENKYINLSEQLQKARQSVYRQFQSVRESYTGYTHIPTPEDYRPYETELDWQDTIRNLEAEAAKLRQWFSEKSRQAVLERRNAMIRKSEQEAAQAREKAEKLRKEEEERKSREKEEAERLLEEMKKKYRRSW